jgi:hypothetical protein
MKQKWYKPLLMFCGIIAVVFAFAACGDPGTGAYVMGTEAELTRLTINAVWADAPGPISPAEYDDLDYNLAGEEVSTINLQQDEDLVGVYMKPQASRGARVAWGIGDLVNRPTDYYDYRVPAYFNNEDIIYIRVTSEDTMVINYYRFYAFLLKKGTSLQDVIVDGKYAKMGKAAASWNMAEQGTLDITIPGRNNAKIDAIPFETSSTLLYAKLPAGSTAAPSFGPNDTMDFTDQDILYIEVTAQNTVDKAVYKLLVGVGRITTMTKFTFVGMADNPTIQTVLTNIGSTSTDWTKVSPTGYYESADMPVSGWGVLIELEDPNANYEFALASKNATSPPAFNGKPAKAVFDNTNMLAIKVTPHGGLAAAVKYYIIDIKLLAANFIRHPESAVYYYYKNPNDVQEILEVNIFGKKMENGKEVIDYDNLIETKELDPGKGVKIDYGSPSFFANTPVVELGFELDRDITNVSYQWWESNSWYGGYGFDQDGRMCYNMPDPYKVGEIILNWEDGFQNDKFHHRQFDEKANPSLFNGGNQAAVYVLPGRPIGGATNKKYTPDTSKRPFLAGFSYETHYYWVVVTDNTTGRQVTSARATIVSERNSAKQHYMIDVNNDYRYYQDENDTVGVPLRVKNDEVFTKQYDKWRFPLKGFFPDDFDIREWKIMTAQARFYLTDGKEWIQNWTNGNLSFEDNSMVGWDDETQEIDPTALKQHGPVNPDGTLLGLFYNLTNANAVYDITSDVKESGSGGGLQEDGTTFTHIVVEPSGPRGNPPLVTNTTYGTENWDGRPLMIGQDGAQLQGWLCGFIEIIELHFEGPR